MGYDPKNTFEKIAFKIAGLKKIPISTTLQAPEMTAVSTFWLTRSNTATIFSTICLTSAIVLFVETHNLFLYIPFLTVSVLFAIRVWVFEKCAKHTLSLWT